ncbi:MAG: helix-turn-helix domain-containing protein [Bacteroidales bacterium]|nr:helix-turn-helix domain-containing protein [Bacteroidales bacterium]
MKNLAKDTLVSSLTIEQLQQALAEQNPATQTIKKFIGIDELSEMIGYKKSTIYSLVHKRLISYYKRGKKLFFKVSEIEDWLQENRIEPISEHVSRVMNA